MKATMTGIKSRTSRHGDLFYHVFFKGEDGKSYLTHCYPKFKGQPIRNYSRWESVLDQHRKGIEIVLDGLVIKKENIIDADSMFTMCIATDPNDKRVLLACVGCDNSMRVEPDKTAGQQCSKCFSPMAIDVAAK